MRNFAYIKTKSAIKKEREVKMKEEVLLLLGEIKGELGIVKSSVETLCEEQKNICDKIVSHTEKIAQLPCKENTKAINSVALFCEIQKKYNKQSRWIIGTIIAISAIAIPVILHYF